MPQSKQPYLNDEQIDLILNGEEQRGFVGVFDLCKITNISFLSFKKSKRSCEIALRIVHKMLFLE